MTTNQRLSVDDIREALRNAPSATTDEEMPAERAQALARVTEIAEKARLAHEKAEAKSRELLAAVSEALAPVTYGHGEAPASPSDDAELLAARGVATEEDQASKQDMEYAKAVLRELGLFTVGSEERHKALYDGLMEQAMYVSVSNVTRGHIVAVSRMTGFSDQTLRRLLELPENYPGFQATAAPTVKATRWGPRRAGSNPSKAA